MIAIRNDLSGPLVCPYLEGNDLPQALLFLVLA